MIDLPLRPGQGDAARAHPSGRDDRGPAATPGSPARPSAAGSDGSPGRPGTGVEAPPPTAADLDRRRRPSARRFPFLWLLALVAAAVLWWLFWPAPARIVGSESSILFDRARVGDDGGERSVTLENAGERSLRIDEIGFSGEAATDFEVRTEDCAGRRIGPGETCELVIAYRPVASGERRAALEVRGNIAQGLFLLPIASSAVAPEIGLAPERVDFGAVQVGGQRASVELTISNVGSAALELGRVSFEGPQADEFDRDRRCPDTSLDPGEACTMRVRFTPRAEGVRVAELVLSSDSPASPSRLPLRGRGVWEGPLLEPDPERLDLGEQRIGRTSAAATVRFSNRTADAVAVDEVVIRPENGPFVVASDTCGSESLVSGRSCGVAVSVAPDRDGTVEGTLEMRFQAAGTLRIPVRAVGVEPRLGVVEKSIDFGSLRTGFESAAQEISVVNSGSATLTIEGARLVGGETGDFVLKPGCSGETLAPGKRCAVGVAFRPTAPGARRSAVVIQASDALEPLSVPIAGDGTVAGLAVDPGALGWGSLEVGRDESQQLVIQNTGTARLQVRRLRVVGDAGNDFAVERLGCALDAGLAPGERCELLLRFAPTAEGSRTATLEIDHNGPDSPRRVALSGAGEPQRPIFRASARDFGFGTVAVGGRSDIATLTVSNPGSAWLPLGGIYVRGENAEDFELVPGTCDGVTALAPGGRCTVGVRFVAQTPGRRRGTLELRHGAAGSPALISLAGVAQ